MDPVSPRICRPRRRFYVSIAALAATACLAVSGCASSSGDSSDSGSTASSSVTASAGSAKLDGSYKIMIIGPYSSGGTESAEPLPEQKYAAMAAASQINAAGGVNGKSIDLLVCDSQGNPNVASECASQAVAQKVVAVVGVYDPVGDYLAPLEQAGIPVIAPVGLTQEWTSKVAFPLYGGLAPLTGAITLLTKQHLHDIAFVYNNQPATAGVAKLIMAAGRLNGATVTPVPFSPETTDFSAVVAKAAEHKAIDIVAYANQSIAFITALRQAGYKTPVATDTGTIDSQALKSLGAYANGLYLSGGFLPATYTANPAVAKFAKAVLAIDPGAALNDAAQNAYMSVDVFADLVKGMPVVTPATVLAKLRTDTSVDTSGLMPGGDFAKASASGEKAFPTLPRIFDFDVVFSQVKNGVVVPLTGGFSDALTGAPAS